MHTINIINLLGKETANVTSGCSSCSTGCDTADYKISSLVEKLEQEHSNEINISRIELSESNKDYVAELLQNIYHKSGEQLIITSSNIQFILSRITPVIAINGKLASVSYVPPVEEILSALNNDSAIENRGCN